MHDTIKSGGDGSYNQHSVLVLVHTNELQATSENLMQESSSLI